MTSNYAILGLEPGVDEAAIKKAYRKLVMTCHPDKYPNDKAKLAEFYTIQNAYDELLKGNPGYVQTPPPQSKPTRTQQKRPRGRVDYIHPMQLSENFTGTTANIRGNKIEIPPGAMNGSAYLYQAPTEDIHITIMMMNLSAVSVEGYDLIGQMSIDRKTLKRRLPITIYNHPDPKGVKVNIPLTVRDGDVLIFEHLGLIKDEDYTGNLKLTVNLTGWYYDLQRTGKKLYDWLWTIIWLVIIYKALTWFFS